MIEIFMALVVLSAIVWGVAHGEVGLLPLQLMALAGLGWVIGLSLWHTTLRRRHAEAPEGEALPEARPGG